MQCWWIFDFETDYTSCDMLKNFKNILETEIQKRFGQIEYVHHLAISTILDPRFKETALQRL
jgi:hypothetical protein